MHELRLPKEMIGMQDGGGFQLVEHMALELLHRKRGLLASAAGDGIAQDGFRETKAVGAGFAVSDRPGRAAGPCRGIGRRR